jgi:Ca2+/Na+ antiporter
MDTASPNPQQILDNEHLRLLSIFHYVKGGITALFACIPIIHVVLGLVFIFAPQLFGHGKDQPPAFLGWLFVILGSFLILLGWTITVLVLIAGRCIGRYKHYTFVMACVELLSMPFGTVLWGVHDFGA